MAVIAYILFFVPLLTKSKNDPFVKYHVKQGLVLFIANVAVSIVLRLIPSIFYLIALPVLDLCILGLLVQGIMHAVAGEQKPLSVIGKFSDKFKF